MKCIPLLALVGVGVLLSGCNTGSGRPPGQVSGVVTDINGGVVRDAKVWIGTRETRSNSSGSYVLERIGENTHTIRAEAMQDGLRFVGQNVVQIFAQERSKSVNIAVARDTQLASLRGTVRDRSGNRLVGAKIFAFGNALSSAMAITDSNGDYEMNWMQAGLTYELTASGSGYNSDFSTVNLAAGEQRTVDFTLDPGTNPAFGAPQNLAASIWTSPYETTRSPSANAALEAIKREFDPRRPAATQSRTSAGGNHIETDLYWDPISHEALLGFGVYRGTSELGPVAAIDFLRDPLAAFFADLDDNLVENRAYYYEVTALTTRYPDLAGSESPPSNRYGVLALGDLDLLSVGFGPRFQWIHANGATSYIVYLYDRYPGLDVTSIWNNGGTRTSSNFLDYTGPGLQLGRRYYYLVLGLANNDDSRTISRVGEFVAN